jgi:peptide/nickel transport system substrate-binding protein
MVGFVGKSSAADEKVLRIGFYDSVDTLNPMLGLNDAAYVFYGYLYDTLTTVSNSFETTSNLALSWEPLPAEDPYMVDNGYPYMSVWQYKITPNAQWHDGEPLTVDDVVYTININADNYDSMWAYQPYSFYMDYAEAIDEETVYIHYYDRASGDPMPAAYANLIVIPILPKHMFEQYGYAPSDIAFTWNGVFDGNDPPLVGSGPFMATDDIYDEWLGGEYITLVKNPNYHWAADKDKELQFDRLLLAYYDDATAMRYALERGQLDVAQFPPHEYRSIKADIASGELTNMETFEGLKVTQYWTEVAFNMNMGGPNPSRLDPAIRQALAMATDKSYIVENFYLGLAEVGTTLVSPIDPVWHYEPTEDELWEFNLTAAAEMLTAAGYIDGPDDDNIREATASSLAVQEGWVIEGTELSYDMLVRIEYPEEKDIAEYLKQVWAGLGVELNYRLMTDAALATIAYSYSYDTMIYFWSDDPDPNFMLFSMSINAWYGWNDNKWGNLSYNENYTNSVTATDPAQRKIYVDNCQRINYLDAGYIILAYPYQTYVWRNDTFSGWGDWAANPGRSIDAFWTGNPLYFDLVPLDVDEPVDMNWLPLALAGAAVVVVVLALIVLVTRKRGTKEKGEGP